MMRYYIIDDDMAIIKTLENIIDRNKLGDVVGYHVNPAAAIGEIIGLNIDIVLVDLLMSEMDGISVVSKLKEANEDMRFIMISKVTDKDMVGDAYSAGVDFFINKPLNVIEIKSVLENMSSIIKNQKVLKNIEGLIGKAGLEPQQGSPLKERQREADLKSIKLFLGNLGVVGEKGVADILNVCSYMLDHNADCNKETFEAVAREMGDTAKNIKQRVRRTIKKGLNNVAAIAIDDFGSEVVDYYATFVYDFVSIKEEMEFVKGRSPVGGQIKINKFIEGLLTYIEK